MSSFLRGKNNPKRNDFSLVPSSTAIIIIDVQEEFSLKSRHYLESLPSVIDNINSISNAARSSKAEVVFTYIEALTSDGRDISIDYKLSGEAFSSIPGPGKAKLLPALTRTPTDIYIPKTSCSVFVSTNIDYVLRNLGIEQVVITGQLTDQCCESAVRDAADLGYLVTVAEDACIASTAEAHKKALYSMKGFSRLLSATHIVNEFKNAKKTPTKIKDDKIECYGKHLNYQETENVVENHCDLHGVTLSSEQDRFPPPIENGVILSLYRALFSAGIKSIRLMAIDVNGSIRAKSVPLKRLLLKKDNPTFINEVVTIAEVSIGGLPTYADVIVSATGLSAANVLPLSIDFTTMKILPYSPTTACAFGYLCEQKSGRLSSLCSRSFLRRIMNDAKSQHGINFNVGVELEFCLYKRGIKEEMISNLQKDNTLRASSAIPVDYSLFASSITLNEQGDFLDDIIDQLENQGIEIEQFHSESASGQLELVLTYTQNALQLADHVVLAKETINACAKKYGMRALFLPKIQNEEAGNGQHIHLSFSDIDQKPASKNSFSTENGISARGRSFMEGILQHLPALVAITTPSRNSFLRIGPGCWTGSSVRWAVEDKESPVRVCLSKSGAVSNVELKLFDASANIYIGLAAVLAAGLDGINRNLHLRPPSEGGKDLPRTLKESLEFLKRDDFLMAELGPELSKSYLGLKEAEEKHDSSMALSDQTSTAWLQA